MDMITVYAGQQYLVTKVRGEDLKTFRAFGYEIADYPPDMLRDKDLLKEICEFKTPPVDLGIVHVNNVKKDEETGYFTAPAVALFDTDDPCLNIDPRLNKSLGL
jgi:hypothetical protein